MCDNSLDSGLRTLADRLAQARSVVVVSHARPDGDALGTMLAIARSARQAGKDAWPVVADPIPGRYEFLTRHCPVEPGEMFGRLANQADCVLVVDTSSWRQLEPMAKTLRGIAHKVVVLDHHATGDEVGSARWVDSSAPAAGVMAMELLDELGWPTDEPTLELLSTAVITDTGWLRFSNTTPRALAVVGRWLEAGGQPDQLHARLYQRDRVERLRLQSRAVQSLSLHHGDSVAVMQLTRRDFREVGAGEDETEDLVNEPLRIGSVEVSVLLTELATTCVRGSLRSKGGVDVSALAQRLGGGGHVRAAGVRLDATLEEAERMILTALAEAGEGD
jgi:phosphoesterase RecJ-like protein